MDGCSCASCRFTIICGPVAVRSKLPGIADVAGGMVRLLDLVQAGRDGVFRCAIVGEGKGEGVAVEFAAFGLMQALASSCEYWKGVPHF